MHPKKQRRLFIDRRIQGDLFRRVVLYWMLCMLVVLYMAVAWLVLPSNPKSLSEFLSITYNRLGPVLTTSLLVLPLVLIDCLRISKHIADPVHHLHREMKRLAQGLEAAPVHLPQDDYWHEVANDFNRLLKRVDENRSTSTCSRNESTAETVTHLEDDCDR